MSPGNMLGGTMSPPALVRTPVRKDWRLATRSFRSFAVSGSPSLLAGIETRGIQLLISPHPQEQLVRRLGVLQEDAALVPFRESARVDHPAFVGAQHHHRAGNQRPQVVEQ